MSTPAAAAPNWLGLLQWSLAHSDGTSSSTQVQRMGDEDRQWLEAVMRDNVKDEPASMNRIMADIVSMLDANTCCENEDRIEMMLEELRDIVEQIDMAQIFVRFGGITCLIGVLESREPLSMDTRCLAVGVIGTLSQNNIQVQEDLFKKGVVDKLASIALTNDSYVLSAKVVYALSCIVRNYPDAEISFGKTYGYSVFQRAVSSGIPAFATRAVFLSNALITSDSSSEEMISAIAPAFLPGSYIFVSSSDTDLREATLRLLISLAKTRAGKAIFASAAGVEDALQARTKTLMTDPDNLDQEKHEQSLIKEFKEALLTPV